MTDSDYRVNCLSEQLELFSVLGETERGDSLWESFPAAERAEVVTRLSWALMKAARGALIDGERGLL